MSSTDSANLTTTFGYDALGRPSTATDPRTGTSTTTFVGASSQVLSQIDATNTTVATYTYDSAGRVFSTRNASGNFTYTTYNDRGQTVRVWGDVPYPIEFEYDTYGRQWKMRTFRGGLGWNNSTWPANPGAADETTWNYHPATGLLVSKVDAANRSVTYTYDARGQVRTRTWARKLANGDSVTTTYGYDPATAELISTTYSDGTPSVTITYNALGQVRTVADSTGTRTLHYSATNFLNQDETLGDFYNGRVVTWKYDTAAGGVGRNAGFSLGRPSNLTGENDITYGYDAFGRFNGLTATLSGAAAGSFTYGYTPQSNQIGSLSESGSGLVQSRSYEPHRDLVAGFATTLGSRTLASYGYTNDELGRRTVKVETGEMYSRYGPGLTTKYGYNARSEVTSSNTYVGTDPAVASTAAGDALQGRSFYYGYDNIGNRAATTVNGQSSTYSNNSLNQLTSRTVPGYADVSGFAAANATVTVAGQPTVRQFDYFYRQHPIGNGPSSLWASLAVSSTVAGGATANETRYTYLAKSLEEFTYDEDGNLKSDGRWDYSWDAENRLVSMTTTDVAVAVGVPRKALQFKYDHMGRRVQKTVNTWNGSTWVVSSQTRFVYSTTNWHLLAEYDAQNGNAVVRTYSWGLDLSRTTTGAGGVGGLLALHDMATSASYVPAYDANGNVLAMVNQGTGVIAAAYEYSTFGETIRATGSFAHGNPIRFSTKYTDAETQFAYYGYRYYMPFLGRFLGRDPSGESGGVHLYGFCGNDAVNAFDYLGLDSDIVRADPLHSPSPQLTHFFIDRWFTAGGYAQATQYFAYYNHPTGDISGQHFSNPDTLMYGGGGFDQQWIALSKNQPASLLDKMKAQAVQDALDRVQTDMRNAQDNGHVDGMKDVIISYGESTVLGEEPAGDTSAAPDRSTTAPNNILSAVNQSIASGNLLAANTDGRFSDGSIPFVTSGGGSEAAAAGMGSSSGQAAITTSGYWDRYVQHVETYAITLNPAVAVSAIAGGVMPKAWVVRTGGAGPALGSTNPLTSVVRAVLGSNSFTASTGFRTGVAGIAIAGAAVGGYNTGVLIGGFAYAAFPGSNGLPPPLPPVPHK